METEIFRMGELFYVITDTGIIWDERGTRIKTYKTSCGKHLVWMKHHGHKKLVCVDSLIDYTFNYGQIKIVRQTAKRGISHYTFNPITGEFLEHPTRFKKRYSSRISTRNGLIYFHYNENGV